jgi:hypothetical protein
MTHLEHVVTNEPTLTAFETTVKDGKSRKERIDLAKYASTNKAHSLESNVVVKVRMARGPSASLAINVLETLVAGLEIDPVGGIAHLKAICVANRNARMAIKPDVATPNRPATIAALPLDADPDAIRKAVKAAADARIAAVKAASSAPRK